jgi:plasmid stabilization system protein ParE
MAQKKVKEVIWSIEAKQHFFDIIEYLDIEAPHAALIVSEAIRDAIGSLNVYYESYPLNRFKKKMMGHLKRL